LDISYFLNIIKRRWKLNLSILLICVSFQFLYLYLQSYKWETPISFTLNPPEYSDLVNNASASETDFCNPEHINKLIMQADFLNKWSEYCLMKSPSPALSKREICQHLRLSTVSSADQTITLTIKEPDPVHAKLFAESFINVLPEKIAETYNQTTRKLKKDVARQKKWLRREISNTRSQISTIACKDFKQDNPQSLTEELTTAKNLVSQLQTQSENLKELKESTAEAIGKIENTSPDKRLEQNISNTVLDEFIKKQRWNILNTQIKILQEKAIKTNIHPDIVKLKESMDDTSQILNTFLNPEGELFPYVATIYRTAREKAQIEYDNLKKKTIELTDNIEDIDRKLIKAIQAVSSLKVNYIAYNNHFNHLQALDKREKLISNAEEELFLSQINHPSLVKFKLPYPQPENKDKDFLNVLYFGIILSLFITISVCYISELIDPRIFDTNAIRTNFKIPVLCVIPRIKCRTIRPPPGSTKDRSILLMQKIQEILEPPVSMVITSNRPEEGSTLVAENLAFTATEMGQKVLLIKHTKSATSFPYLNYKNVFGPPEMETYSHRSRLMSLSSGKRTFSELLFLSDLENKSCLPIMKTQIPGLYILPPYENYLTPQKPEIELIISEAKKTI